MIVEKAPNNLFIEDVNSLMYLDKVLQRFGGHGASDEKIAWILWREKQFVSKISGFQRLLRVITSMIYMMTKALTVKLTAVFDVPLDEIVHEILYFASSQKQSDENLRGFDVI